GARPERQRTRRIDPTAQGSGRSHQGPRSKDQGLTRMPTALIVEDEPEANKLLAMLLQLRGYQTVSAYRGGEALEKLREHAPAVVFLDLMLPDMDGYDVCRSLHSSRPVSLVPVVIVTARLTAENRIESFEVGADDYIPKPYTPDQIFEALE